MTLGVGLSALGLAGASVLQSIFSTSPRRLIMWNGFDQTTGIQQLNANGNPVLRQLFPQVTLEEKHLDRLRKTEHPVEQGASVADHAYKLAAEVQVRAGWSFGGNTAGPNASTFLSSIASIPSSLVPRATDVSELQKLYALLLSLQTNRVLVTLQTGKRRYSNMLLETLGVDTDQTTENALVYVANFSEFLFAQTHVVSVPPSNVMANPQSTGATVDQGSVSLLGGGAINKAAANAVLGAGKLP